MNDKVQKIKEWVKTRKLCTMDEHMKFYCKEAEYDYNLLCSIENILDTLQKEPVSEDLEEACEQLAENARKHKAETSSPFFSPTDYKQGVMDGAKWQKEQMMAKAVDGTFSTGEFADGTPIDAIFNFDKVVGNKYEEGEKVKIIVIKK